MSWWESLPASNPVLWFLGAASLIKSAFYYRYIRNHFDKLEYVGTVTDFFLYPLKSGHGVRTDRITCDHQTGPYNGAVMDRRWMVMSSENVLINYQKEPLLVTLTPKCDAATLTLESPRSRPLVLDASQIQRENRVVEVRAYGVTAKGLDCGDEARDWINRDLGSSGYRLVYAPPAFDVGRPVARGSVKFADWVKQAPGVEQVAYQSVTPYHLITWQSMQDLNSRLNDSVDVARFRPNIVIKGKNPAYDEDSWREVVIGNVRFKTIKLTGRCTFTCIDPDTGEVGQEPLKTLNSYRRLVSDPVFGPCLGIHSVLQTPGAIRVGDPVYVIRGDNVTRPTSQG